MNLFFWKRPSRPARLPYQRDAHDRHVLFRPPDVDAGRQAGFQSLARIDDENFESRFLELFPDAGSIKVAARHASAPSDTLSAIFGARNSDELKRKITRAAPGSHGGRFDILRKIPPEDIHRMQRGKNWIGDLYAADLVMNTLTAAGVSLADGSVFLDYGGSSGSLLRVLACTYPAISFIGTDPVRASIQWASDNLSTGNLKFLDQEQRPPISAIETASIDCITAISIFSHHGYGAFEAWMAEMHRILKPGAVLLFTAHGPGSVLNYHAQGIKPTLRYERIAHYLYAGGFAFEEVWIEKDDAGNVATTADWGNAFYTRETVERLLGSGFKTEYFGPRGNQSNQDVYVVRKV